MTVNIITSHGIDSSRSLAKGLNDAGIDARVYDVRESYVDDIKGIVFSYGSSASTSRAKKRYNGSKAVKACVDKVSTFEAFKRASVPTCKHTKDKKIAEQWGFAICRESSRNRRNEGMFHWYAEEGPIPNAELYTEWFDHVREYRVVVFLDQVFMYFKSEKREKGTWDLNLVKPSQWRHSHSVMEKHALAASKALGIDYVGYDVLVNAKGQCCFLEANSSPIMCDEVQAAIIKHFVEQKKD